MDTAVIERLGIVDAQSFFEHAGWKFLSNPPPERGVDALLEVRDGALTGRWIGLQIKSGKSYFDRRGNAKIEVDLEHLDYWRGHSMPVVMIARRPDGVLLWRQITQDAVHASLGTALYVTIDAGSTLDEGALPAIARLSGWDADTPLFANADDPRERGVDEVTLRTCRYVAVVGRAENVLATRHDIHTGDGTNVQTHVAEITTFRLVNVFLDKPISGRLANIPVSVAEGDTVALISRIDAGGEKLVYVRNLTLPGSGYTAANEIGPFGNLIFGTTAVVAVVSGAVSAVGIHALGMPDVVTAIGAFGTVVAVTAPGAVWSNRLAAPERDAVKELCARLDI